MSDDKRTEQLTEANKLLRKVISGKGKIQANFYFAGDAAGKKAGLIVTLTARDKTGKKAASQGKALRKSISSAKFALGVVVMDGNKLTFEQRGGSASPSIMKKAFKGALITPDKGGLSALKYLSKARIRKSTGDGQPDEVEEGEELSFIERNILTIGALSRSELKELQREQGDLTEMNRQLSEGFLSAESVAAEIAEARADSEANLSALEDRISALTDDADPSEVKAAFEALYEERKNLSELASLGPDPFEGGTVDETFLRSLEATSDQSSLAIRAEIAKLGQQAQALLKRAEAGDFADWQADIGDRLQELQVALNRCLRQLDGVLAEFGVVPKSKAKLGPPTPTEELSSTLGLDESEVETFTTAIVSDFTEPTPIVSTPLVEETQQTTSSIRKGEDTVRLATEGGDPDQIERAFEELNETRKKLAMLASLGPDPFEGGTVDETFLRSLEATSDRSLVQMRGQLSDLSQSYDELIEEISSRPGDWTREDVEAALAKRRAAAMKQLERINSLRAEFV